MNLQATFRQNNVNELIVTSQDENGEIIVNGRDLHEFLGATERYNSWMNRMIGYGFVEGTDFTSVKTFTLVNNGAEREIDNHALKLDMAKHIGMIQKNKKGKEIRDYFIKLESFWNSPEMITQRYNEMQKKQIDTLVQEKFLLENKLEEQKPKVLFAEAITASTDSILLKDFVTLLTQNGINTGEKRLFNWMKENKYLKKSGRFNIPTQKSNDKKLFELLERPIFKDGKEISISLTPKLTAEGQKYFINKFLKIKADSDIIVVR